MHTPLSIVLKCALAPSLFGVALAALAQTLTVPHPHLAKTPGGTRFLLLPAVESEKFSTSEFVPYKKPLPEFIDADTPNKFKRTTQGGEIFIFKKLEEVKSSVDGKPSGIMAAVFENAGKDYVAILETPANELKSREAGSGTSAEGVFKESDFLNIKKNMEGKRFFSPNCGWWEIKNGKIDNANTPSLSWVWVNQVNLAPHVNAPIRVTFKSEKYGTTYFMDLDPYSAEGSYSLTKCLTNG